MRRVRSAAVFLDTSAVVCAVQSEIPHHRACRDYRNQLVSDGRRVVISQLLRIEYAQTWYRLPTTDYVQPQLVRAYRLGAWDRDPAARHRLRSHDALHVATALAAGVPDFATVDADFRRVSALRLHLLRDSEPAPLA